MRRPIAILFGTLVVAWLGWSIWWYVQARGERYGVEQWLAAQRDRGWQAETASLETAGYPTEIRLRAEGIALADPANGWAWAAPALTIESDPWAPTRFRVAWPAEQTVSVPGERVAIRTASMRTLLDLRPGPALELREAATELAGLELAASTGWSAAADAASIRVAERPEELAPPNSYDIRATAEQVRLPKELVDEIDPTGWLSPQIDGVTITGHVALAEPISRATVEEGRLALRAATLREAGFRWGEMRLVVSGAFEVDEEGFPVGEITVEAEEWRQMVRLAESSGLIEGGTAAAITRAVEFVTALTGSGDSLSLPLNLSGGKLRIGPFAIADAPRLAPPSGS